LIHDPRMSVESAVRHASTDVPIAPAAATAREARELLVARRYESASHVVVCEGGRFVGLLKIEALLAAPPEARLGDLMDRDAPFVAPGVDQEVDAWEAVRHEQSALSVVDEERRFVGLIPPHRLLAVLLSEHEEDLSRFGGFIKKTTAARATSEERVRRRFWHRIPWLLLGLAGALVAADLMSWFEVHLRQTVMLAFFIPGIVYLADAVGTQTETVVVRGLSIGVPMRRMALRELLAGIAIGVALAAVAGPLIAWRWGNAEVALAVALALFVTCSTATVAAMALPWLFDIAGQDPAFGSGPLATVIQDLLSILAYLGIAAAVIG
jgi:magnesium transporter